MKTIRYDISRILWFCLMAVLLTACNEEMTLFSGDDDYDADDAVTFTTYIPVNTTRASDAETAFNTKMSAYKVVAKDYEFIVEMYQQAETTSDAPTLLGSAVYVPTKTIENQGQDNETVTYAGDGTLILDTETAGNKALYWPGNAKKYGFKATAGTTELEIDQDDATKVLAQDRLLGYGFEPVWVTTDPEHQLDDENTMNFHTSKEWYQYNKQTYGMVPGGVDAVEFYKKIPLYLQHQRSMVTIILKAGEGVERNALTFEKAQENIHTYIYSYKSGEEKKTITPFAQQTSVNYTSSDYGTVADGVETTQYTAVVEPYDYLTGATSDAIAEIQLSGQRFSFYASNDFQYKSNSNDYTADALAHMNNYNLAAGKHLIITATLGRASRKILITAYVEDWTEAITTSIVDDYGKTGDPIQITTRKELYDFLNDATKNKPGNVAIIVPNTMNLEKEGDNASAWNTPMPLNCTLNLAGATLYTDHQVFSTIGVSGNIVNGNIAVGNATVETAVAQTNLGTIEHVSVLTTDANNNDSDAKATRAGLVVTNSGTITRCTSQLPVKAVSATEKTYIGGIAAISVYSSETGNTMPVIDGCTVDARVDEADGENTETGKTFGGGIVGAAVGRVTNNRFEYGITIQQNTTRLKNIVQSKADDENALRAYNNSWPTTAENKIDETNAVNANGTAENDRYTAVIDSESDLEYLLRSGTYNTTTSRIRLSDDFAVTEWVLGTKDDQLSSSNPGNVFFELDGNDKTITTDGMLFTNIQNDMYDLTVKLSKDLIATHQDDGSEAIAALAYSVTGANTTISNIKVKGGNYRIQAYTVGGIVVWAYSGATIEKCQCKANIQVWTSGMSSEAKTYAGGIAACAAQATFTQCTFHNTEGTLYQNTATTYTDTANGTETETGIFYGGILGGTVPKTPEGSATSETPNVLITDCTSWFSTTGNKQKGAIVGYAQYPDGSNNANGIATGCQGNWWNTSSDGIGTYLSSMTIEQIIGKRNAVTPTQDSSY